MANQTEIPAEMLDAALEAIGKRLFPVSWHFVLSSPSCQEYADTRMLAKAALEAANVGALLGEIASLKAELAKHQESQFHPNWSALEATRESLRETWAKLKEMERTAADALREAE